MAQSDHGKPVTQTGGRSQDQLLLICEARIHPLKGTDLRWRVVPAMVMIRRLAFMIINMPKNLTTDSSEVRNDGEVEAYSTFKGPRTWNPHVQREEGNGHAHIILLWKELSLRRRERRTWEGNLLLEAAGWKLLSLVLP